ncbi:MAG: c-type cytochrome domain-containing protein, partial [Cyclobacteriaceae bacterium]
MSYLVWERGFIFHEKVDFNAEVRPILNKKCITCHGGVKRSGEFSLLFRTDALSPNESGKRAIVPGDVEA